VQLGDDLSNDALFGLARTIAANGSSFGIGTWLKKGIVVELWRGLALEILEKASDRDLEGFDHLTQSTLLGMHDVDILRELEKLGSRARL
jgi:hypothetical protein